MALMRIRMLESIVGSPDDDMNRYGYEAGQTYTASEPLDYSTYPLPISEALAAQYVSEGRAVAVDAEAAESGVVASAEVAATPVEPAAAEASTTPAPASESEPT